MLLHLAYAYTFTRTGEADLALLNALGRACGWLFREAQRPGQQHVVVATSALRDAYTFPAAASRQGHLGFLLAWLSTDGGREAAQAAASAAERHSISTTMEPSVERNKLEPHVEAWRKARKGDGTTAAAEGSIHATLTEQLTSRFELTVEAWETLRLDPRRGNRALDQLIDEALDEQWFRWGRTEAAFLHGERPFVPSVETDRHPAEAAAAYGRYAAAAEQVEGLLLHDDRELLAEAIARGNAFIGTIVDVRDEGAGRTTRPVWVVEREGDGPSRMREGSRMCVVGLPTRTAHVRSIRSVDGTTVVELAIVNLKTAVKGATGRNAVPPKDPAWCGQRLAFAEAPGGSLAFAKAKKLWNRDVPGAWLTFSTPPSAGRRPRGISETSELVEVGISDD
jgi:hypothetical protein